MALQGHQEGMDHRTTKGPCEAKGGASSLLSWLRVTLDDGRAWMPIRGFRLAQTYRGGELPRTEFLSSGSTQSVRARHAFSAAALQVYARDSTQAFVTFLEEQGLGCHTPVLSCVPTPSQWPTSSLAAMLAFFEQGGLPLLRVDVETTDFSAQRFLTSLATAARTDNGRVVVFGTSVHHILVARALAAHRTHNKAQTKAQTNNPLSDVKKLLVVDTGGTKGRTESYSQKEFLALLRTCYEPLCETLVLGSEYGMCELASQAYAVLPEGLFTCNPGLKACAVDLRQRRILPPGEVGFLAFEDARNTESETLVVTEDLGWVDPQGRFKLLGRAPDATLKGCSLNVKSGFLFDARRAQGALAHTPPRAQPSAPGHTPSAWSAARIENRLRTMGVSSFLLEDLRPALQSVEAHWPQVLKQRAASGATALSTHTKAPSLCVVSSANVPVVFLYPMVHAWALGCEQFDLKLPSLRPDDALATRVRGLQEALVDTIAPLFEGMSVSKSSHIDFEGEPHPLQRYLVFGTDSTCSLFEKQFGKKVAALGDVTNALDLCSHTWPHASSELAEACLRFFGRGCLTPVAAFVDSTFDANTFAEQLSRQFLERLRKEGSDAEKLANSMHAQDVLEICYLIAQAGHANPRACLHEKAAAWVVDLRDAPQHFHFQNMPWTLGGSGLVFLLPSWAREVCLTRQEGQEGKMEDNKGGAPLSLFPTNPGVMEPHLSEAWQSRLKRLFS